MESETELSPDLIAYYNVCPFGVYRTTPQGRIVFCNDALIEMLGYDNLTELADERNLEHEGYQPEYERSVFKDLIERVGKVVELEAHWTKKDGTLLILNENAWCVRSSTGAVLYYDGLVYPWPNTRFVDNLPIGFYRMDLKGGIIDCNQALAKILEYPTSSDLKNTTPAKNREAIWESVKKGRVAGYNSQWKKHNGDPVTLSETCVSVEGPDGKPLYFEGVVDDQAPLREQEVARYHISEITHYLQSPVRGLGDWVGFLKLDIHKFVEALPKLFDSRPEQSTWMLDVFQAAQNRFAQLTAAMPTMPDAEKKALKRRLQAWTANNSEVADILLIFKAFALKSADLDRIEDIFPQPLRLVAAKWFASSYSILQAISHITSLTPEINKCLREIGETIRREINAPTQVDLNQSLDEALVQYGMSRSYQNIVVKRESDPDLEPIDGHPSLLLKVWTNLIENAVSAMNKTGVLTLRTYVDREWAVVDVEDNGPGISDDDLPQIWNRYFTTKPEGTGLGLATCDNYVRINHRGRIEVNSSPQGTRFTVRLPRKLKSLPLESKFGHPPPQKPSP